MTLLVCEELRGGYSFVKKPFTENLSAARVSGGAHRSPDAFQFANETEQGEQPYKENEVPKPGNLEIYVAGYEYVSEGRGGKQEA